MLSCGGHGRAIRLAAASLRTSFVYGVQAYRMLLPTVLFPLLQNKREWEMPTLSLVCIAAHLKWTPIINIQLKDPDTDVHLKRTPGLFSFPCLGRQCLWLW